VELSTPVGWSEVIYYWTPYFAPYEVEMGLQEGGYPEYSPVGAIKHVFFKPQNFKPPPHKF
jgi:hypothetical protein